VKKVFAAQLAAKCAKLRWVENWLRQGGWGVSGGSVFLKRKVKCDEGGGEGRGL
jgi:hypothetical protein